MPRPGQALRSCIPTGVGALVLLALVSAPVELTIELVDHPVMVPSRAAMLLLLSSCLLMLASGLGLRRIATARAAARRPTPGA